MGSGREELETGALPPINGNITSVDGCRQSQGFVAAKQVMAVAEATSLVDTSQPFSGGEDTAGATRTDQADGELEIPGNIELGYN